MVWVKLQDSTEETRPSSQGRPDNSVASQMAADVPVYFAMSLILIVLILLLLLGGGGGYYYGGPRVGGGIGGLLLLILILYLLFGSRL